MAKINVNVDVDVHLCGFTDKDLIGELESRGYRVQHQDDVSDLDLDPRILAEKLRLGNETQVLSDVRAAVQEATGRVL